MKWNNSRYMGIFRTLPGPFTSFFSVKVFWIPTRWGGWPILNFHPTQGEQQLVQASGKPAVVDENGNLTFVLLSLLSFLTYF